jgi:hypothetical protein
MMDTLRLSPTPYGAYSNTERVNKHRAEMPALGTDSPAAGVIGKRGRVKVAHFWFRTGSERQWARRGRIDGDLPLHLAARGQHDGVDWDRLFCPAAPSQHDGVDWDRLFCPATRSQHDGVDWDCARDRRERTP